MPDPVTAITTGASLAGSAMSASGANKASKIQKQAADAATQLQRDIYNQNREDLAPYRQTGTAAQNRLAYLMGLSPSGQSTSSTPLTREQLVAQLTPKYTTSTNGNWYVNGKGQLVDVSKYMIWNQQTPPLDLTLLVIIAPTFLNWQMGNMIIWEELALHRSNLVILLTKTVLILPLMPH